jgi:hypothetical protein
MPDTPIQTSEEETEAVKPEPETKPAEPAPAAPVIDYEKKFQESARENQLLREAQAEREKAEQELTKEPTDSELKAAFPSWDVYDDTQKEFARRTFAAERTAVKASAAAQELKSDQSWNTSIELAITSDAALQGKEQAFRQFASQPKYRNSPMDLLVGAFLQKAPPSETPKMTPKPGLEPGNGGPRSSEKPKTLTTEQLTALRTTSPKAYQDYLKTHDIEIEV